jgi:DNA-directed RNA polymerase specialized sigma24 family protein
MNETIGDQGSCDDSADAKENELLVRGCILGDQRAWEALIGKYKRLIFSIPMITYGARPEDAADVFQAVCIEVLHSLPQLKSAGSLRAWLITVTLRQSYGWKKKQANHLERAVERGQRRTKGVECARSTDCGDDGGRGVLRAIGSERLHRIGSEFAGVWN